MKKSGTTTVFVVVCAVVLCASYAIGLCIREIRFRLATAEPAKTEIKTNVAKVQEPALPATEQAAGSERRRGRGGNFGEDGSGRPSFADRGGPGGFENMSEEERAQMRERFAAGGGRQGMMTQMSEEDREKMMTEMEDLRARREEMSDEEYQQAMTQLREKYGIPSRGFGGAGGRRRGGNRSGDGQQENTMN